MKNWVAKGIASDVNDFNAEAWTADTQRELFSTIPNILADCADQPNKLGGILLYFSYSSNLISKN